MALRRPLPAESRRRAGDGPVRSQSVKQTLILRDAPRDARKRRSADVAGQAIFRLSEFGAIAQYAVAVMVLEHNFRNQRPLFDAAVFAALGVVCYCVGWTIRFVLTRRTDLV